MWLEFKRLVLFSSLLVYSFSGFTQIDSLRTALQTQKDDSNRVKTLIDLSSAYLNENLASEAIQSGNAALNLAQKIKFKKGEALANQKLGLIYQAQNDDSISFHHYFQAAAVYEKLGDYRAMGQVYYEVSYSYMIGGNYPEALNYQYKSLKSYEALNDTSLIANSLGVIGHIHMGMKNYSEALASLLTSKYLFEKIGNKGDVLTTYGTLAQVYRITKKYKESLKIDSVALTISKNLGNEWSVAWLLSSIGRTIEMMGTVKDPGEIRIKPGTHFEEALKNYFSALNIFQKIGQSPDSYPILKMYSLIASVNIKLKNFNDARTYLENGLQLATQSSNIENLRDNHQYLSLLDSIQGNFEEAYYHYRKYLLYDDSLSSEEDVKKTLIYKMQYDSEKNEIIAKAIQEKKDVEIRRTRNLQFFAIAVFFLVAIFFYFSNRQKQKAKIKIEQAYNELKATQQQLIQSEKMASLGELTAGIAHEIQNPLNFVNNFSEINDELIKELQVEAEKGNLEDVKAIAKDIEFNSQKVNHHGKRADSIVKGMLQHSRASTGQKEPTDINALADEYLRLAFHGLRAKDKSFNATMKTDFDGSLGKIDVVPQDVGRVLLNLINNAFYAVDEKKKQNRDGYDPTVSVSTRKEKNKVEVKVTDNGSGIPQKVLDKMFQPFFTTKPTGQGTGLGLSLAYDIVKAHGGELKVVTKEGEGSEFIIQIPVNR